METTYEINEIDMDSETVVCSGGEETTNFKIFYNGTIVHNVTELVLQGNKVLLGEDELDYPVTTEVTSWREYLGDL